MNGWGCNQEWGSNRADTVSHSKALINAKVDHEGLRWGGTFTLNSVMDIYSLLHIQETEQFKSSRIFAAIFDRFVEYYMY